MTLKQLVKQGVELVSPGFANRRYLAANTPTEAEIALLPGLVKPGSLAIDIGANRGLYLHHLLKLTPRVVAFEPLPAMQDWLRRYYGDGIALHPTALSDHSGTVEIRFPKGNHSWATIAPTNQLELASEAIERLQIPMCPLDQFGFEDAAFIKIDVEGHEESVLKGASRTIAASQPNFLIEIEERHSAGSVERVRGLLAAAGYTGFSFHDGALTPIEEFDAVRDQDIANVGEQGKIGRYINNFIFVPTSAAETLAAWVRGLGVGSAESHQPSSRSQRG